MEYKISTSIPITFEKLTNDSDSDSRFVPVKILLCHTGENLNGSYFSKEVLEDMAKSLANIPILGYIRTDNLNEDDFSGHEQKLVIKDNDIEIIYLGRAYGLIPENHNARFEMKLCDDNIEREFLVCDGYLWTKFQESINIFERKNSKGQSMELVPDSIAGSFQKDGLFHFTKAVCEGACVLGDDVTAAMRGSVIEKYAKIQITQQLNELISEFSIFQKSNTVQVIDVPVTETKWKCPHCSTFIGEKELYFNDGSWFHSPCKDKGEIIFSDEIQELLKFNYKLDLQKGGKQVEDILKMLEKFSLTLEDLQSKEINYEDCSIEDLEKKVIEVFEIQVQANSEPEPVSTDFTLTSNQLEDELRRELAEIETLTEVYWDEVYTYPRYYYRDCKPDENIVIAMDEKNWYLVGFSYSVSGDNVEIDASSIKRYKVDFQPMDLSGDTDEVIPLMTGMMSEKKSEFMLQAKENELQKKFEAEKKELIEKYEASIQEASSNFETLKQEYETLEKTANSFEAELSKKAKEERANAEASIFEMFSKELTEDEMKIVKDKASEFSLEEIQEKLFSIAGRKKISFSAKGENQRISYPIIHDKQKSTGKAYDELFEKYAKKNED